MHLSSVFGYVSYLPLARLPWPPSNQVHTYCHPGVLALGLLAGTGPYPAVVNEGLSIFYSGLDGLLKLPVKREINYAPLALRQGSRPVRCTAGNRGATWWAQFSFSRK